jgi:hypothetical protein
MVSSNTEDRMKLCPHIVDAVDRCEFTVDRRSVDYVRTVWTHLKNRQVRIYLFTYPSSRML